MKRRFKKLSRDHAVTLLHKLSPEQLDLVKSIVHDEHRGGKLLPKSRSFIEQNDAPRIARKIMLQHAAHNNPHLDYHYGGGILETINGIASTLHHMNPVTGAVQGILDHVFDIQRNQPKTDHFSTDMAELVEQAYEKKGEREQTLNGWTLQPELSNDFCAVYQAPNGDHYLGVRGTRDAADVLPDLQIALTGTTQNQEVLETIQTLANMKGKVYVGAHSLGAALVRAGLQNQDVDKFDPFFFNPGSTTLVGSDQLQEWIEKWQPHLFINGGDLISQGYNQVIPKGYDRVQYGKPGLNPLKNHTLSQWIR